jgi:DNA-binding NarL/FixJ family response regulator
MLQLPNSQSVNIGSGDSGYKQPEVILLNQKQWTYVQNRYNLTPRERQVAEMICKGFRNGNIAKFLRIKPGTVKTHTRNIYRKVYVKSKIAMLLRFVTDSRDLADPYV